MSLRRKYDHITPVLKKLHWLPVEQRINYKILLLAYVAQQGMDPPYLSSLLSPYKPGRPLLSVGKHLVTTPHYPITTTTTHHCHYHYHFSEWLLLMALLRLVPLTKDVCFLAKLNKLLNVQQFHSRWFEKPWRSNSVTVVPEKNDEWLSLCTNNGNERKRFHLYLH